MAGHVWDTVEDKVTGRPVNGASVAVLTDTTANGGTEITIYSDEALTTVADNPVLTDSSGFFEFYTSADECCLEISYGGSLKRTIENVKIIGSTVATDLTALTTRVNLHDTVFGLAASATDLGTFTGSTIGDNDDVVGALQSLEVAVEAAQPLDAGLTDIAGLAVTDGNIIVGDGANWVVESGATARASLGLTIGTDVQAYDAQLADVAGLTPTDGGFIVGDGANFVIESGTTALASLGIGAGGSSLKPTEQVIVACSDESTAIDATGTKIKFRLGYAFTVTAVRASLGGACTTGTFTVDINESGTTILSTKLTIDATEKTSTTAATAAVISDSSLADDAELSIDVDDVGDSTATGLKVVLIGYRT